MDRAYRDLQEELIGRGYNIRDTASVPQQEMQLLRVKSGYDTAESSYQLALRAYRDATLYAPFDGTVANLFSKVHNTASTPEAFCTIVGAGAMSVEFSLLAGELPMVHTGREVDLSLYDDMRKTFKGRTTLV